MTPIEYAQACAKRYAWQFGEKVKGPKHVARVALNSHNYKYFLNRKIGLPEEKVVTDHINGGVAFYTSQRIYDEFKLDLYTAGLDAEGEHYHDADRLILSRKYWLRAVANLRLLGQIVPPDRRIAARVAGIKKARATLARNEFLAERAEREELMRREREALARAESDEFGEAH